MLIYNNKKVSYGFSKYYLSVGKSFNDLVNVAIKEDKWKLFSEQKKRINEIIRKEEEKWNNIIMENLERKI